MTRTGRNESDVDARARRAGRLTAAAAAVVGGTAAFLVLLAPDGTSWATTALAVCVPIGVAIWLLAYVEMSRHQHRAGLPAADREAWQRRFWPARARGLAILAGAFVPWFYLLGTPAQRRLAQYERAMRKGRKR